MMKRIVCIFTAVMVLTSSVFAWDAYSFTGVYDIASQSDFISYTSFSSSESNYDYIQFWSWATSFSLFPNANYVGNVGYPAVSILSPVNFTFPSSPSSWGIYEPQCQFSSYSSIVSAPSQGSYTHYDSWIWPYAKETSFVVDFTVPASIDYSVLSMSGSLQAGFHANQPSDMWLYLTNLEIYVNGFLAYASNVLSDGSSSSIPLNDFVYNASGRVSTISIHFTYTSSVFSGDYDSNQSWQIDPFIRFSDFSVSFLSDFDSLSAFTDQAQDDINSHEAIESQWTSSMSSNFDALQMDTFTFPSGLVSGFGLITGIFQDLWNAMGEYKILFVFPLTLGVALLLIGRISKFSGGQSSSRSNRGDDGA